MVRSGRIHTSNCSCGRGSANEWIIAAEEVNRIRNGEEVTLFCRGNQRYHLDADISKIRTCLLISIAIRFPSLLHSISRGLDSPRSKLIASRPVAMSHRRSVPSVLAVANRVESGFHAADNTNPVWPSRRTCCCQVVVSYTIAVLSSLVVANNRSSALKTALQMYCW